jgi:hypothetical protein
MAHNVQEQNNARLLLRSSLLASERPVRSSLFQCLADKAERIQLVRQQGHRHWASARLSKGCDVLEANSAVDAVVGIVLMESADVVRGTTRK